MFRISTATMQDASAIAELSRELGYDSCLDETEKTLSVMLGSSRYFLAVARSEQGTLMGWIAAERRLSVESGESAEITGLVVAATARRTGVGKLLVSSAESWAMQEGFESIIVRSNVNRAESHPFYRNMGFQLKKTQHCYSKQLKSEV